MSYFKQILRRELNKPKNAETKKFTKTMTGDYFFQDEKARKENKATYEDDEKENDDHLFKHPSVLSTVNVNVRVDNWLHNQPNITTTAMNDQVELELTPAENNNEKSGVKGLVEWANEETTQEETTNESSVEQENAETSTEKSVPISQEVENDDSDDTLVDSEELASVLKAQEETGENDKEPSGMPALSLIGSEVFHEPLPTGSLIGSEDSSDKANLTADSSIFDNGSNVMIKKKKTKKLDISYMNRIRDDFLGDDSPSNRPGPSKRSSTVDRSVAEAPKTQRKEKKSFTVEEDELIKRGLQLYGTSKNKWSVIKSKLFKDSPRSNVQLKDRARSMGLK